MEPKQGPATVKEMLWLMELNEPGTSQFRRVELMIAILKSRYPLVDIDNMESNAAIALLGPAVEALGKPDIPKPFLDS